MLLASELIWLGSFGLVLIYIFIKVSKKTKAFEFRIELEAKSDQESAKAFIASVMGTKRTNLKGESLSHFEIYWMQWRLSRDLPGCIDCENGDLISGPSAGINVNVKCNNKRCGSAFNMCLVGFPAAFDRISDRSPNTLPRRW